MLKVVDDLTQKSPVGMSASGRRCWIFSTTLIMDEQM